MAQPGFSLTELIQAVSRAVEFYLAIKNAPKEVQELAAILKLSHRKLQDAEGRLQRCLPRRHEDVLRLGEIKAEYQVTIDQIKAFLEQHPSLTKDQRPKFKDMSRVWIKEKYTGVVTNYRKNIKDLNEELRDFLLNLGLSYHEELIQRTSTGNIPTSASRVESVSSASQGEVTESTSIPKESVGYHEEVKSGIHWQSQGEDGQRTLRRTRTPERSSSLVTTVSESPTLLPPLSSVESFSISEPPIEFSIKFQSKAALCFQVQGGRQPVLVAGLTVRRSGCGRLREIILQAETQHPLTFVQHFAEEQGPTSQASLQMHNRYLDHLRGAGYPANFGVQFLSRATLYCVQHSGSIRPIGLWPEYSFESKEDCRVFQQALVADSMELLDSYEVDEIASKRTEAKSAGESIWQVIQLWQMEKTRRLVFFRNNTDRGHSFHDVSSLRVVRSKGRKVTLHFIRPATVIETQMGYLKISFTTPKDAPSFLESIVPTYNQR